MILEEFTKPLINLIQPKIIIAMGTAAYDTIACIYKRPKASSLRHIIAARPVGEILPGDTWLFAVYHCSNNGRRTRNEAQQRVTGDGLKIVMRRYQPLVSLVNTLGANLAAEGKSNEAVNVIDKAVAMLPMRNYSIRDSVEKYRAASILYSLNETDKANAVTKVTVKFLADELQFLSSLHKDLQESRIDEIRLVGSILNGFREEAAKYRQKAIVAHIDGILSATEKRLAVKRG